MFLGIGNLVNPAAIALTKTNAYQAAKVVLGLNAPTPTLLSIAEKYTAFVIPQANRALTVPQILGDINFTRFVSEGKDAGEVSKLDKVLSGGSSSYGLTDSIAFGIPNWVLYGGVGVLAYRYYRKKRAAGGLKLFGGAAPASVVPTAIPAKA